MAGRSKRRVVTLMYHGVIEVPDDRPPDREEGAALYDVDAALFERQLRALGARQIPIMPPGEETADAPLAVRLTFDDGEANNFVRAWPVLRVLGVRGHFFVVPARVGRPGYMSWDQVAALARAGMDVGSHGMTHRILAGLPAPALREEIAGSKQAIEDALGAPVRCLSVPRGFHDQAVLDAAREAGYARVFVSDPAAGDGFVVGRIAVKAGWRPERLLAAVAGRPPLRDRVAEAVKGSTKRWLGPQRYDRLRALLLATVGR